MPRPPFLSRIEPSLGLDEPRYREHAYATDKAQARNGALLVLVLSAGVAAIEAVVLPTDVLALIIPVRLAFLGVAVWTFFAVRRDDTPRTLDRAALVFSLAFAVQYLALFALRPPTRADEIGAMMLVLACYALSPAPLWHRTLAPVVLSAGAVVVLDLTREAGTVSLLPTAIVLIATNALGLGATARLHTQRRREFQSQDRLRLALQERDLLIDRLRQSHKMESMGRLVGGVAHDFNNILGSMFAAVEFLLSDLPRDSPSRHDAEALRAAVKRGADLTKQLLAFSRQQVLELRVVSLNDVVSDTQRMLVRTIGEHVAITVALGEHLPSVRVDPGQVQQILLNLAVNARDAMPDGGTLQITTRKMTLAAPEPMAHAVAPPGPYVVLSVADTGTGMDAPILAQIFEPFFTTKPKGRGTGLGLSTVFGIVEQSGGYVRVTSALGRGTTFDILLPALAEQPSQVPKEKPRQPAARGTETILLAEDDEPLRRLLARVLAKSGYRVLEAADGLDALRVAEAHEGTLELLASDVVMPAMGGQRLAEELTSRRPGIKVLLMSGYTEDAFVDGTLAPGTVFLQKPVDPALLLRRVRELLDDAPEARETASRQQTVG